MFRWTRVVSPLVVLVIVGLVVGWIGGCSSSECKENSDCPEQNQYCLGGTCVLSSGPEPKAEPVPDAAPSCPNSCNTDTDCLFCGTKRTCDLDSRSCVDARELCPDICNNDEDCQRTGCGARQACNQVSGTCYERIPECPASCESDNDCGSRGCGERTQCSTRTKTCVDPTIANCPFTCRGNDDCKLCGTRNTCSFTTPTSQTGICRVFGTGACPASCQTTADCFTNGCGEKLYCNYALSRCVDKSQICPLSCSQDSDCRTNCGTRTFCYQSQPDGTSYCRTPPTRTTCPDSCRTSYDCKAKACGEKVYCNTGTQKCVAAANACPGRCQTNADCAASKCGALTTCRANRCQP